MQEEPLSNPGTQQGVSPAAYEFTLGGYASPPVAGLSYASFGQRFAAMFLDGVLIALVAFPASFMLGIAVGIAGTIVKMPHRGTILVAQITGVVLVILVRWFYFAGCESSAWQATLGKKALNIQVTDVQGRRISFGRASKRFFSKYLSSFCLGFGFWSVLWNQRSQGWHDRIADTLVLSK